MQVFNVMSFDNINLCPFNDKSSKYLFKLLMTKKKFRHLSHCWTASDNSH